MNGPINKGVSSALPRVFSRRSAILKIVKEKALGTRLETERDSAASVEALRNFHHDSLKVEQIECLQWVLICLREDILAVLPTGFGKDVGVFEK